MTIYHYEDLQIWQQARELSKQIYACMQNNSDYGFCSQIQRAAVSVMNNIAEGFNRGKHSKDNKVFTNFLSIAYGSCGEVRSMLYLAEDLDYIHPDKATELRAMCKTLERKIDGLTTTLKENEKPQ
jgi:four helix bundle protein